jgi:hypothetical protein
VKAEAEDVILAAGARIGLARGERLIRFVFQFLKDARDQKSKLPRRVKS